MQIERYRGKSANNTMTVVISPNIKKTSDRMDASGNIIDARTKQILEANVVEVVSPEDMIPKAQVTQPVDVPYTAPEAPTTNAISIQAQIDEAKANLAKLEELKKLKIAEMEAQLELLKQ